MIMPHARHHALLLLWLVAASVAGCQARPPARTAASGASSGPSRLGPLRVHPHNPRYFTDDGQRAIYLTGSHTWSNLVDMAPRGAPARFDFPAYLDFLDRHGHNFIRLWAFELIRWNAGIWDKTHRLQTVALHPWSRTGPGQAVDGGPRFDLTVPNPEYFGRLRERVAAARARGIYVSVMLFEGYGMQDAQPGGAWEQHPFHPTNNINGLGGDVKEGVQIHELVSPAVTAVQEAYVRKVIDTVNDLDNVLYEISNENHGASTAWQYHMIRFIKEQERTLPRQHPVGMTFQQKGGTNQNLFDSPADWISPSYDDGYKDDPPAATGKKVILSDTDHLWGLGGELAWVWKSFTRGLNPLLMDGYDGSVIDSPLLPDAQAEPLRRNLGHTLRYARRMKLAAMTPQGALSSSGYCLADPGREYLVFVPGGDPVTVDLTHAAGSSLVVEWFNPADGQTSAAKPVAGGTKTSFAPPFPNEAVLYLRPVASPAQQP